MGDLSTLEVIIIAIVEGLTEFLPVSSTGHMIITQNLLGIESTEFVKAFTVIIQFGAILSVVWLYWKRFFRLNHTPVPAGTSALKRFLHKFDFYWKLLVAFVPALCWLPCTRPVSCWDTASCSTENWFLIW